MSDSLQPLDVATRVVRWHNRHWLARRIRLSDVESIGVVVLPWAPGTASLEDGAAALTGWKAWPRRLKGVAAALLARLPRRPSKGHGADGPAQAPATAPSTDGAVSDAPGPGAAAALVPAFTEAFAPGLTHEQVVSFARIHGREDSPAPADWPRRQIRTESEVVEVWLYLLTAGLSVEHHRPRLLLGPRPQDPILGRRVLSPLRVSLAVLVPVLILALMGLGVGSGSHRAAAASGTTPHAASAAVPASTPDHAESPPSAATARNHTAAPAASEAASSDSAPHHAPAASEHGAGAQAPQSASDVPASAPFPGLESAHAPATPPSSAGGATAASSPLAGARRPHEDRPHARPLSATAEKPLPSKPEEPVEIRDLKPVLKDSPVRDSDAGQHFALMSRGPRDRAAAQALLPRMEAAARTLDPSDLPTQARVELIENRGTWHAVWWPFPDRQTAMQARWALALRGITVDLVAF